MRLETIGAMLVVLTLMAHSGRADDAAGTFAGHWLVTSDLYGTPLYGRLDIEQQGAKITGHFNGDKFEVPSMATRFISLQQTIPVAPRR